LKILKFRNFFCLGVESFDCGTGVTNTRFSIRCFQLMGQRWRVTRLKRVPFYLENCAMGMKNGPFCHENRAINQNPGFRLLKNTLAWRL
jgi:hypothetical protein